MTATPRDAFGDYLRTGRRTPKGYADAIELKFNPNHDPANGRFTFGQGGVGVSGGNRAIVVTARRPVAPKAPFTPHPNELPIDKEVSTKLNHLVTDPNARETIDLAGCINGISQDRARYHRGEARWRNIGWRRDGR